MKAVPAHGQFDGVPMRWLESAGNEAAEDGTATVVLIHGIPTSPELWRNVLPLLSGLRSLAWEMVGYGDSIPAGVGRDISVARQADYLLSWLRALGIERAILVGHDLGGGVAQIAAVRDRERCAGLVLTHSIGYASWPVLPMKALRSRGGALFRRLPEPLWRRVYHAAIGAMHDDRRIGRESARIHWAHYAKHGGGGALVRQARSLDASDTLAVVEEVRHLEVPARVVWGDADPFQTVGHGARLASDLGTSLRAIPGGRHYSPEDHPAPIADAIRELAGLEPVGGSA